MLQSADNGFYVRKQLLLQHVLAIVILSVTQVD